MHWVINNRHCIYPNGRGGYNLRWQFAVRHWIDPDCQKPLFGEFTWIKL